MHSSALFCLYAVAGFALSPILGPVHGGDAFSNSKPAVRCVHLRLEPASAYLIARLCCTGVFTSPHNSSPHIGVAIGDHVLDLHVIASHGLFASSSHLQQGNVFKEVSLLMLCITASSVQSDWVPAVTGWNRRCSTASWRWARKRGLRRALSSVRY